tara:strand:+ start:68 stop:424 length:357 start_codon:yes stop_codon:yes gene_type:complete
MSTENIKLLIIGVSLTFVAQVAVWFQHNWQFVNKKFGPEWWGWYLIAIPITWLFLKGTQYNYLAFDNTVWPNRFIGFTIGVITYVYLTTYYLDEPVSWKIAGQLLLCFGIVLIQIFWK